jgi:hypothetical protein
VPSARRVGRFPDHNVVMLLQIARQIIAQCRGPKPLSKLRLPTRSEVLRFQASFRRPVLSDSMGQIESTQITVLFKDGGSREANNAAAISAVKQLAFRLAD